MSKSHQYWETKKQEEFARAVSRAQMECFQNAAVAMFCFFLAAWAVPEMKPIAWIAFFATAIIGLFGEVVMSLWLERFDTRFRVRRNRTGKCR